MAFYTDYKEEVKKLISETYVPADSISKEFQLTTYNIVKNFQNIFPENAIDEHMVFEALQELGYEPKEEEPLCFFWYFRRI